MVSDKGKRVQIGEVSSSSAVHDANGYEIQKQRSLNGYIFTACLAFPNLFKLIAFAKTSFSFGVPLYLISDSIIVEMLPFELLIPDSIHVEKPPFELQNGKYLISLYKINLGGLLVQHVDQPKDSGHPRR